MIINGTFSSAIYWTFSIHFFIHSKGFQSDKENTTNIPSEPLKYPFVNELNLSYPAVSQIYSLIFIVLYLTSFILKSIAIVAK